MANERDIEPSNSDITEAQKLLRELSGAEPYAAYVAPTARMIARVRKKETEFILKEVSDRLQYDSKRDHHYMEPYQWNALVKKLMDAFSIVKDGP